MKTTKKNLSTTRVELTVVLNKEDLAPAKKLALEKLSETVKVKGFRKGKVPKDIAEKNIDSNTLMQEVVNLAVNRAIPLAFKEVDIRALMLPDVKVTKYIPDEVVEFTAEVDIYPDVKLGKYKGLKVKKPVSEVKATDVTDTLNRIAESFSETKVTQRKAKKGDEVVIDFVGKKDGEPFEGGSAKDYKLRLGSGQFIPGFEEGIVGLGSGDKKVLPLSFPKDYHSENLAGKKVEFDVLVKQVNEVIVPKLDDEFAKKCGPFKTLAELKSDIKKNLTEQGAHQAGEKYKDDLVNELVKGSKVDAPEILIEDQLRAIRRDLDQNLKTHSVTFENYLKQAGKTEEEWKEDARKIAETRVKAILVLQELSKELEIKVSDGVVEAKIIELREVYKKNEDATKQLSRPEVLADIKNRLVIEQTVDELVSLNQ